MVHVGTSLHTHFTFTTTWQGAPGHAEELRAQTPYGLSADGPQNT